MEVFFVDQTAKPVSSRRNYGLDLLRLTAAFYVVIAHTTGLGGVLDATAPDSNQNFICRLLMIFTICAVTIYGIVSGYVGYREEDKKVSFSGYLSLWLTVVFYSLLFLGIFRIVLPGSVTSEDLLRSLTPVTTRIYWYFSCYTVVYFLSPFLNRLLRHSSDHDLKWLFLFLCVLVLIEYIAQPFHMGEGYSVIWLVMLYLFGGIMKKTGIGSKIPSLAALLGIFLINFVFFYLGTKRDVWSFQIYDFSFVITHSLVSPFYLATGFLHVVLFSRFRFKPFWQKVIAFAAPASFSIYIVNTNKVFWNNFMWQDFMKNYLASWAGSSPVGIIARILLFSAAFVFVVTIVDFLRQKLFQLLGVPNWDKKITGIFRNCKVR